ncbi:MAG: hypothetical protein Q8N23_10845 [Archangium sp.]|nr:hypothetical protein [Archangium sp.]MDP3572038.1 hypothetical protein [Archangium sp.]
MSHFTPQSPLRRLAAFAAVCLFAGAGLSQTLHEALVRHVRCAVHGEWVHANEAPLVSSSDRDLVATSADDREHTHEHCVAHFARAAPTRVSPWGVVAVPLHLGVPTLSPACRALLACRSTRWPPRHRLLR